MIFMKVEIENMMLLPASNFLYGLKLVRKQSRMRRRFIKMLNDRNEEFMGERKQLQEEYSNKDEEGNAIIINDEYDIPKGEAWDKFIEDTKELSKEKYVIEGGDNREMIRTIQEILRKFEDEEYEGQESDVYDYLCEEFKIDEEERDD